MRYIMLLLFICFFCTSLAFAEPAAPPFMKMWSFQTKQQIFSKIHDNIVDDKILCYYTDQEYGAVAIATGSSLWKKSADKYHILYARCHNNRFHIVLEKRGASIEQWHTGYAALYIIDPSTGREVDRLPIAGICSDPEIKDGTLYCLFKGSMLTAIDIGTKKRLWTREIPLDSSDYYDTFCQLRLKVEGKNLFLEKGGEELLCIDGGAGEIRWQVTLADSFTSFITDSRKVYLLQDLEISALDAENGRQEWAFHANSRVYNSATSTGELLSFVGKDGILYAINTENGGILWSYHLPLMKYLHYPHFLIADNTLLLSLDQIILAFSLKGQKLWEFDSKVHNFNELVAFNKGYLSKAYNNILRYQEGPSPEPPVTLEGRKILAEKLVSRFDDLDDDEKYLLTTLGDQAFDALLPIVISRVIICNKAAVKKPSQHNNSPGNVYDITEDYNRFNDAIFELAKVTTGKHTSQLFSLLSTARKTESRMKILQLLSEKGDDTLTVPYFIKEIERTKDEKDSVFSISLHAITKSKNPAAVEFLLEKLSNVNASLKLRAAAYLNLGRTGGERGARAVLAARDKTRTIPSLESFAEIDKLGMIVHKETESDPDNRLIEVMRDNDNRPWGLAQSYILGSFWDIWILESDGSKWKRAIFTGKTLRDMGAMERDWFTEFACNTDLSRDSDGDGWTDEVEKRLGTDAFNKDTDGDGLIDSVDKNPLAAPRDLSEEEKILRAAFEARFCFSRGSGYKVPCLVKLPEGVQPLEFLGFNWIIVPEVHGKELPLSKCIEMILHRGLAVVSFHMPRCDFENNQLPERESRDFLLWNADRTEAKLSLSTYYGPLNGTGYDIHVKKFVDEWIVISIIKTWVS